jgi:hypothetical protein
MFTPLYEIAKVTGGRITPTHHNACPALGDGPCHCGEPSYRVVRSRPAKRGGRGR